MSQPRKSPLALLLTLRFVPDVGTSLFPPEIKIRHLHISLVESPPLLRTLTVGESSNRLTTLPSYSSRPVNKIDGTESLPSNHHCTMP